MGPGLSGGREILKWQPPDKYLAAASKVCGGRQIVSGGRHIIDWHRQIKYVLSGTNGLPYNNAAVMSFLSSSSLTFHKKNPKTKHFYFEHPEAISFLQAHLFQCLLSSVTYQIPNLTHNIFIFIIKPGHPHFLLPLQVTCAVGSSELF